MRAMNCTSNLVSKIMGAVQYKQSKGSILGIKTCFFKGRLYGLIEKPLFNHSLSYSKATILFFVKANVPLFRHCKIPVET